MSLVNKKSLRLGAPLLSVALVFSLIACASSTPESNDTTPEPAPDTKPLEVWSRSGPEAARTYQAVFDAFTAKTGIEVNYFATVEFETQLQARAAAKDLPDVLLYDQASMASYAKEGMILPIDRASMAGEDQLSEDSWDSVKLADGTYYGVPFSQHPRITLIRKDWREALGLEIPQNHDDLIALATAFATQDPDGNGEDDTYGIAVPGTTDRGYFAWWATPFLWQRGGDIVSGSNGKYTAEIASPESVAAAEWLQVLFCTSNLVQPGALTNASASPFFADSKAGIYMTGPYDFAKFAETPGSDTFEVIAGPAGPVSGTTLQERTSIYFGATSNVPEQQQALAEFLISEEGQKLAMTAPGQPTVRYPVNTNIDAVEVYGDERWETVKEALADSRHFPSDIDFTVARQEIAEGLNSLFGQCQANATTLSDLANRINEALDNENALK